MVKCVETVREATKVYRCEVCGGSYETPDAALRCEQKTPELVEFFKPGTIYIAAHAAGWSDSTAIKEIDDFWRLVDWAFVGHYKCPVLENTKGERVTVEKWSSMFDNLCEVDDAHLAVVMNWYMAVAPCPQCGEVGCEGWGRHHPRRKG